jgi:methylaspartate mutase epsilon subunit
MTSFGAVVAGHAATGRLVVQPRMGFGDPAEMRAGLLATRAAAATTVGTITLDSYTRVGDLAHAAAALADGSALNGYPIITHTTGRTRDMLTGVTDPSFPVQVRHGSPSPQWIVRALVAAGLDATEGGPVSYCLPYGRAPLRESVDNWRRSCELLVAGTPTPHVESFGGCLLGQLCPPSLLIAVSVLEALFFTQHGIGSVSLSYSQQTRADQDEEALAALRTLATEYLPATVDRHLVLYTYMGVFPPTADGATELLAASARLAVRGGAERLIVKTVAESRRIPTIAENVEALELAAAVAATTERAGSTVDTGILAEARTLVDTVLDLSDDVGTALVEAFARGLLDVPFCLHPDNAGRTRGVIAEDGTLRWADTGAMPIARSATRDQGAMTSARLLTDLQHVARTLDEGYSKPRPGG